jgi:hypothetical protein
MIRHTCAQQIVQARLGPGARTVKVGQHTGRHLFFVTFHTSFHGGEQIEFAKCEVRATCATVATSEFAYKYRW